MLHTYSEGISFKFAVLTSNQEFNCLFVKAQEVWCITSVVPSIPCYCTGDGEPVITDHHVVGDCGISSEGHLGSWYTNSATLEIPSCISHDGTDSEDIATATEAALTDPNCWRNCVVGKINTLLKDTNSTTIVEALLYSQLLLPTMHTHTVWYYLKFSWWIIFGEFCEWRLTHKIKIRKKNRLYCISMQHTNHTLSQTANHFLLSAVTQTFPAQVLGPDDYCVVNPVYMVPLDYCSATAGVVAV